MKLFRCTALYLERGTPRKTEEVLYADFEMSDVLVDLQQDYVSNGWPHPSKWIGYAMVQVIL